MPLAFDWDKANFLRCLPSHYLWKLVAEDVYVYLYIYMFVFLSCIYCLLFIMSLFIYLFHNMYTVYSHILSPMVGANNALKPSLQVSTPQRGFMGANGSPC